MPKVVILHDYVDCISATPDELDTMVQVEEISRSLIELGYEIQKVPVTLNILEAISKIKKLEVDFVFNLVESFAGSSSLIHIPVSFIEALNIKYAGCPSKSIYLSSNKVLAKKHMVTYEIPTPDLITSDTENKSASPGKYILKPIGEDASIGIDQSSVIESDNVEEIKKAIINKSSQYGKPFFAERYIDGREFNISIISDNGNYLVMPPAEIQFAKDYNLKYKIIDYNAKWLEDSYEFNNSKRVFDFPESDNFLLSELKRISSLCWEAFGLKGYARVDFRVDSKGIPMVIEVNANPCISHDSGFFSAASNIGINYQNIIRRIIGDLNVTERIEQCF